MKFETPSLELKYGSGSEASEDGRVRLAAGRTSGLPLPTFNEIAGKYPVFANALSVYAAGSVVQGWGHANSDLDLYVVTEEPVVVGDELESFVRHVSTEDPVIRIVLGEFGAFRADIEVWRAEQIDEVIARFDCGTPSQETPELDKAEQDMLYRLASGSPLQGESWWRSRRAAIDESGYGLWLAENRKLIAETFLEDVAGLLISGDHETALLAAHEAFTGAVEAVLAASGDYSINRKWLYRRLLAFPLPEITVDEAWAMLTMRGAHEDTAGWAERTARTTQRLLLAVEAKGL
ncbi:hypothetical protein [Streptosporangium sp. NPDC051022]|uniref:hypothetical protein n=1 Tax=Streptosporangium sp. NPDC051022 TaxID=3155752 RepID=UPI0034198C3B